MGESGKCGEAMQFMHGRWTSLEVLTNSSFADASHFILILSCAGRGERVEEGGAGATPHSWRYRTAHNPLREHFLSQLASRLPYRTALAVQLSIVSLEEDLILQLGVPRPLLGVFFGVQLASPTSQAMSSFCPG